MTAIHDILLPAPIPHALIKYLLFGLFTVHLLFVLLMLGTAILAMAYFIHAWWGNRLNELRWDKKILRMFLMHKSLAVVFGVGPLLLIQVGYSIPFFTAVVLFSPFWLLIIAFLIISFLSFDSLGHRITTHRYIHLVLGILAMITILCVPGFFVAVLVAAENAKDWTVILQGGFGFDWRLSIHWFLRYLHVLGASLVFAGAFHYFFTARVYLPSQRRPLLRWMLVGLLVQIILGFGLYLSLLEKPGAAAIGCLGVGILFALVLIWLTAGALQPGRNLYFSAALPLLLLLLVSMLLVRQQFQDKAFAAITPEVTQNAHQYETTLATYQKQALNRFHTRMQIVYDKGSTIYAQSCSFCHGAKADGRGPDASDLKIPPEDLAAVRANRSYLQKVLRKGIDGTAMPGFDFYSGYQLNSVLDYLDTQYHILGATPEVKHEVTDQEQQSAEKTWAQTCASCHGPKGKVAKMASGFTPPPPDLTNYSLTPDRAFEVITHGYPGTQMESYAHLSDGRRWALVKLVLAKRTAQSNN